MLSQRASLISALRTTLPPQSLVGIAGNAVVSNYVTAKDESGDVADDAIVIDVTAYAVQADGFGTAQAAWTATFGA